MINISKGFPVSTDTFIGTFRRSLLRANHLKEWGAKLPAHFRHSRKGQRGCQGKLEGKTRLCNRRRVFTYWISVKILVYNFGDVRGIWIFAYI